MIKKDKSESKNQNKKYSNTCNDKKIWKSKAKSKIFNQI